MLQSHRTAFYVMQEPQSFYRVKIFFFFFFAFNVKKNISVFQSQLEFLSNVLFWKGYLIIPKEAERSELSLNRDSLS